MTNTEISEHGRGESEPWQGEILPEPPVAMEWIDQLINPS